MLLFLSQNLERAYLTHPFHCCAFKFPEQHDPQKHREYLKNLEKFHECKNEIPVTETTSMFSRRRKRSSSGFNDETPATESNNFDDEFDEGMFHNPVEMNRTLIANCGNLSPMWVMFFLLKNSIIILHDNTPSTAKRISNVIPCPTNWIHVRTWWAVIGYEAQFGLWWRSPWLEILPFLLCFSPIDQIWPCRNSSCVTFQSLTFVWASTCCSSHQSTCTRWENISMPHMIGNMVSSLNEAN